MPFLVTAVAATLAATMTIAQPIVPPLTIHLIRRCPPVGACLPPAMVGEMKEEAERIWSALGVPLTWSDSFPTDPLLQQAPHLVVMLEEHPNPIVPGSERQGLVLGRLYAPLTACGATVAHLWVAHVRRHVDAIRLHGLPLMNAPARFERLALARALGRTLAHEIGHYLLGPAHASSGLMRPQFGAQELLETAAGGHYDLDDKTRTKLSAKRTDGSVAACRPIATPVDP